MAHQKLSSDNHISQVNQHHETPTRSLSVAYVSADRSSFSSCRTTDSQLFFMLSSHTAKLSPNLIPELEVPMQAQPQLRQSYETRSRHDTPVIAIMKHYTHERFTSSQIVSIMFLPVPADSPNTSCLSPIQSVFTASVLIMAERKHRRLTEHTWLWSDLKMPNSFLLETNIYIQSVSQNVCVCISTRPYNCGEHR